MTTEQESWVQLNKIFMPYFNEQVDLLKKHKIRLSYYTKCETADKLIRNQELWLRNCRLMNDSEEVSHGVKIIGDYFGDERKAAGFANLLDSICPGALAEGLKQFEDWKVARGAITYLMAFSRHAPPDSALSDNEETHGRLSMWRGYGGPQGVALVFNVPVDQTPNGKLIIFLSPVGYFDSVDKEIEKVMTNIEYNREFLSNVPASTLSHAIFIMLIMAATCLKHPGFKEEDEWRLLYLPTTWKSPLVREEVVEIRKGHPETICKIPFSAFKLAGINGMDPNALLDKIIVGPSEFPEEIKRYMIDALRSAGVRDPETRVHPSGIPFRHSL